MTTIRNPDRDVTRRFLDTVHAWIAENAEVLVVLRYLHGAGSKDYALIGSSTTFDLLVERCPPGTDIIVFKEPQLPVRGIVDDTLASRLQEAMKDDDEYLIIDMREVRTGDPRRTGHSDSMESLASDLEYLHGRNVAGGICPPFWEADSPVMISASKGGIDGPR